MNGRAGGTLNNLSLLEVNICFKLLSKFVQTVDGKGR